MTYTIENLFNKSLAFLEVAIISSKSENNPIYNTSEYSNVTAYLLYHSTELFLKFAICASTNKVEHGHDIYKLHEKYKKLFTDEKFEINIPFNREVKYLGFTEEQIEEHKNKYSMPFEQQLKYPVGSKGETYNPITSYDTEFLEAYKTNLLSLRCSIYPCTDI